ncbi:MAG: RHS repeat-associated core domain-containing protein [Holophagales bacterium]|nr:MAG: RHS repeat-associated core domain-containing protein [Holophagales bacterium]
MTSADVPGVAEPVQRFYDAHGRLDRVEQGAGAALRRIAYAYDAGSGYLASVTDALARTTRFEHDEAGRVTKQILPDLREVTFAYDLAGNVTSVTPPTRPAHQFGYTPVDQLSSYTPPDVGFAPRQTSYAYNADGQVTTITRPDGQVVSFGYEASGRPDFVTLPTGMVDYSYDATSGRVSSVTAPGGYQSTYSYEGPLLSSITTSGPVPGTVGFGYDADLRPSSQTLAGGPSVTFGYDADGLLTSAGALTLTRDVASGQLQSTTLGTTSDVRTRTGFAELDVYTARISGETLYSYDLDRDVAGRIRKKTETVGNVTRVWEYGYYPERGWLKEVKRDNVVVESYVYDGNGNRTAWSDFWGTSAATYDAQDRMLTAGGATYTYTNNGELHQKTAGTETTVYSHDVRGALVGVDLPNGIAISYVVDADGRRIGKRVNGVLTKGWLYAGGLAPVAEVDALGQVTATFVYATKGNVPDYVLRDGTSYRLFTDPLGSVRLVVEATTGALVQQIDYDAFGRITYDSNPGFQPFGFAGGLYDPQTGLTRFGARDYDPEVGRWTSKDPIGFNGGDYGLYSYAGSDPVNEADPTGLAGVGHHYVPVSVFSEIPGLSPEATAVFDKATTGPLTKPNWNVGFTKQHIAYNNAARNLLKDYMTRNGITPSAMTADEAATFVAEIRAQEGPVIHDFLQNVEQAAARYAAEEASAVEASALAGACRGVGRALGIIGFVPMILDAWDRAQLIEECERNPCAETLPDGLSLKCGVWCS